MIIEQDRDGFFWSVGVVESEGCIDAHGVYPRVRVSMCDKDIVGRLGGMWDAEVRLTLKAPPHKPIWTVQVKGAKAAALIRQMLPYLGARRSAKAAEVLSVWELRNSDKRSVAFGGDIERPPLAPKVDRQLVAV